MSHILNLFQNARRQNDGPSPVEVTVENVEAVSGLRHTRVEQVRLQPESRLVYHTDPNSPASDRFRFLRGRLHQFAKRSKLKTLLITSPLPDEGKSTIALNLATALAEGGNRSVLLIDADFHQSFVARNLGLETWAGLAECLDGTVDPLRAVRQLKPLEWFLLPTGEKPSVPTDVLQTPELPKVVNTLAEHFDWVIIDSPPVMPITDALCLMRAADGVLVVVKAGQTPKEAIEDTLNRLGKEHVVGMILNGVEGMERIYSSYHGYR
jgi:capsular exopolysaccharide synthesis family protein